MTVPDQRCENTDLLVRECAHCKPPAPPPPRDTALFGTWFDAGFESDCDGQCGGVIEEGEPCRSDGEGGWLCVICGADD